MKKLYTWILLLVAFLMGSTLTGRAQNESKLSVTTQMFLQERDGKISFEHDTRTEQRLGLHPVRHTRSGRRDGRIIASPDTIDGKVYISAFVRLEDNSQLGELEAEGVVVQETFDKGLITALIPIEKIEAVANIANVSRINVASLMSAFTHDAREKTNTDDVLTLSTDAISAGLKQKYDGSGVVLGVIDTGIDFNHIAFKDKNGNSRIKQAYVYDGSTAKTYTGSTITSTLTDDNTGDHGTHTSTTAGGSSVKVSGTTVTVTDDHANATYGGMAPGADLYLAGIKSLSSTYLANAVKNMCTYADGQGKPLVVSNSWGSQVGPHDGTGDVADVYNSLFGDSHPNRVALFAASNDAGNGGYHLMGTATSSNPLRSILRFHYYSDTDDGFYYNGIIANAWARSTSVSSLTCKIHVLNANTGARLTTVTVNPTTSGATVSGLSNYYSGTLYAYKDYVSSSKTQVLLYASGMESKSYTSDYQSNYTLAVEFAPSSGSSVIDVWGGNGGYFTNHLTTSGYNWTAGTDDGSYSDEATIANAIPIGAYVSKNTWTDSDGKAQSMTDTYTMGDIAYFSSWGTAANNPAAAMIPWISAPGARLAAGVNHNHTTSVDNYSYWGTYFKTDLVVNNTSNPYAMMEGTSMATPTAAGIVALWMQASLDENAQYKNLTVNDVKKIMKETAITDSYTTTGANKDHFGNGKIDALAGIKMVLGATNDPTITADPTSVTFSDAYATKTYTQTVKVTGVNLTGNITVSKSGSSVFTIDKTSITKAQAEGGVEITVTYKPTAAGTQTGTLTLTSAGASTVTVPLSGTAQAATPTIESDKSSLSLTAGLNSTVTEKFTVSGRFLSQNVTATLNDANGVFSLDKTSLSYATLNADGTVDVTVSFRSASEGTFTGSVVLSSTGAANVTVNLSATANDGGKASDAWLDIAKYKTIDDAGWRTALVNNLYQYTEDEANEVAWLTLPVYGAFVGAAYATNSSTINSGHPQAWIETNITSATNAYAGTSWAATDVFKGNAVYHTSTTARAIGYNSKYNYTQETVTFYVTNMEAVKLLGTGQNRTNATYPASLKVYECTKNSDGSLTASTTAVKSYTNSATSGTFTLSATGLDASKIYKVEASTYRSYLCEIGFQTPIEVAPELTVTPSSLSFTAKVGTPVQKTFTLTGKGLKNSVTIAKSGDAAFTVSPTTVTAAQAKAGQKVTVTYNPSASGSHTGTLTLSSAGAESQTVSLSGTAVPTGYDLTVSKYGLSTLYLDYDVEIPYSTYEDLLGVYVVKAVADGELRLGRLSQYIPANTGVIVQANSGTYTFPSTLDGVAALSYESQLQGVLADTPVSSITVPAGSSLYTLGLGSAGYVAFYRYSGTSLRANSAYLIYNDVASVKGLNFTFEDGTTLIQNVETEAGEDAWYNVQGVRLNGAPKVHGVYIHNGKKVLVK